MTEAATPGAFRRRAREFARRAVGRLRGSTSGWSAAQPLARRRSDARRYWSHAGDDSWAPNSHWFNGLGEDTWVEVSREHLTLFETFAKALDAPLADQVVIDWGCGGGANAVVFAPRAKSFIAADVAEASVAECLRQVASVCDTPTQGLHIDIDHPERAVSGIHGTCDLFLCLYVLELTAGAEDALRIVRIAEKLLAPGGIAMIQVKYRTQDSQTRSRRRNYSRNLANMTTFWIDDFWNRAAECGLTPRLLTLVPRNSLDARYAYYALTKPS